MSMDENVEPLEVLVESLLASITEIINSTSDIKIEQKNLMDFGKYLHRTSPIILELQSKQDTIPNARRLLDLLLNKIDFGKDLVCKCKTEGNSIKDSEIKSIIGLLEEVTRNIGEDLSSIPSYVFSNKHIKLSIQSLSAEMTNARFPMSEVHQPEEPVPEDPIFEDNNEKQEINHQNLPTFEEEPQLQNLEFRKNDSPRLAFFLRGMHYAEKDDVSNSFNTMVQGSEYMEPLYDTFFCPLTRKIMDDPVILRNGITFERKAITEWLKKLKDGSKDLTCPITGQKLETIATSTNLALKSAIEEWKKRNDATKMKVSHSVLLEAGSKNSILEAMGELKHMCKQRQNGRVQMHSLGFIPLLAMFVEHDDIEVRYEALQTLTYLAEDKQGKEKFANMDLIASAVGMLSSDETSEQHVSLSFLLELSKSKKLCEKIGSVPRAIWRLFTLKCNKSIKESISEKAGKTLRNLERCPKNIKCMAENGFLDPLLNNLVSGPKKMQLEMASLIGELVHEHDINQQVAQRASPTLLKMILSRSTQSQKMGFKALVQISSHHPNSKALKEAGVAQAMMEEMFKVTGTDDEPIHWSKKYASVVLANIFESVSDPETLQVELDGHKIASDYATNKLVHMVKHTMPNEMNLNITKILISLMKFQEAAAGIVKAVEEADGIDMLVEFFNYPNEELGIVATKLLIKLSQYMGHKIAETLFKISGQVESLLQKLDTDLITETQVVSAELLASLPHKNLMLNQALLNKNMVQMVLETINKFQRGGIREGRDTRTYLEGLVGILVRFTTTLHDKDILYEARQYDLTQMFAQLVSRMIASDEIQRLAAVGLGNLSSESINLSKKKVDAFDPRTKGLLPRCCTKNSEELTRIPPCPVHRGACSSSTTFCLIESGAIKKLLVCLKHQNALVVEAALSAVCTLLDDRVDVDKSLTLLCEMETVQYVLNIFREQRKEEVWHKSFWLIEKFLARGKAQAINEICSDRMLPSALVTALHNMNTSTTKLADNISRQLSRMPNSSRNTGM